MSQPKRRDTHPADPGEVNSADAVPDDLEVRALQQRLLHKYAHASEQRTRSAKRAINGRRRQVQAEKMRAGEARQRHTARKQTATKVADSKSVKRGIRRKLATGETRHLFLLVLLHEVELQVEVRVQLLERREVLGVEAQVPHAPAARARATTGNRATA